MKDKKDAFRRLYDFFKHKKVTTFLFCGKLIFTVGYLLPRASGSCFRYMVCLKKDTRIPLVAILLARTGVLASAGMLPKTVFTLLASFHSGIFLHFISYPVVTSIIAKKKRRDVLLLDHRQLYISPLVKKLL